MDRKRKSISSNARVFPEFETNRKKEGRLAGIAAAKAKGKHRVRPPSLTAIQKNEIRIKKDEGMNPSQLSVAFGVFRATIYNVLKEAV